MITLQLIDLPFDADVANPLGRPLGTRESLATRVNDLLPGTQFDAEGRGVFRRGSYEIAFKMYGDPPTSIGVAFEQPDAFAAIARLVEKTNWSLIDPDRKMFVDLAASRAAGKAVTLGDEVLNLAPAGSEAAAGARSEGSPRGSVATTGFTAAADIPALRKATGLPRRTRLLIAALTGLLIGSAGLWYANKLMDGRLAQKLPTTIRLSQQETPGRIERYEDRVRRRAAIEATIAPEFRDHKIVQQMLDMQLASRAYWNFIDGKFTSPEVLSSDSIWSRYKMPTYLPASFAQKVRDGYEFEFRGAGCEMSEPNWPECTAYAYFARPVNKEGTDPVFALFSGDEKIRYSVDGSTPGRDAPTINTPHAVR